MACANPIRKKIVDARICVVRPRRSGFAVDLIIFRGDVGHLFLHWVIYNTVPSYSEYGTFILVAIAIPDFRSALAAAWAESHSQPLGLCSVELLAVCTNRMRNSYLLSHTLSHLCQPQLTPFPTACRFVCVSTRVA